MKNKLQKIIDTLEKLKAEAIIEHDTDVTNICNRALSEFYWKYKEFIEYE